MAVIAKILGITWFPDYPDKNNIPPNTNMTVAQAYIRNTGSSSGYISTRLYSSVNGSDWSLVENIARYFHSGDIKIINITWTSPNSPGATWHVAVTTFGDGENEPSLPDPATCP